MALCMEVEVCSAVNMGSDTHEKIRVRVTIISLLYGWTGSRAVHVPLHIQTGTYRIPVQVETSIIGYLYLWKMINVAFLDLFLDVSTF